MPQSLYSTQVPFGTDCQEEAFAEAARALRQKACTGTVQALRLLEQSYPAAAARLLARLTRDHVPSVADLPQSKVTRHCPPGISRDIHQWKFSLPNPALTHELT